MCSGVGDGARLRQLAAIFKPPDPSFWTFTFLKRQREPRSIWNKKDSTPSLRRIFITKLLSPKQE
jgi:hypothetical protein